MLARKIHHLRHLGLGDFVGEDPTFPDSMVMDVEHDLGRGFDILLEEFFQHMNDEFHRRVVVVQDQHPVEVRPLGLRLDLGDDARWQSPARDAGIAPGSEKKSAFESSVAPAIMIAITLSGNNNLRRPLSYSYARSWQKAGPEAVVFL